MVTTDYPRLKQIGCTVKHEPCAHVPWTELDEKLSDSNIDRERFNDCFGIQTVCAHGPFAWDVEAVLERMMSGQLVGTQRHWD